eukprot:752938-Hanusia_phi.AAC.7
MGDTVQITTEGGEQFFKHYYSYLDTARQNLKHLYHEASKVVWNGNTLNGKMAVDRFFSDLPASKHEPFSLDCQPIASPVTIPGQDSPDPMILVSVMGFVRYGHLEAKPVILALCILLVS